MHPGDIPPLTPTSGSSRSWAPWLLSAVLGAALLFPRTPQAPSPERERPLDPSDREVLDHYKQELRDRNELSATPSRFVVPAEGGAQLHDGGYIYGDTYTQVVGYPLMNTSRFHLTEVRADIILYRADDSVIATMPVVFEGGMKPGETKVLPCLSPTLRGRPAKIEVHVTRVISL